MGKLHSTVVIRPWNKLIAFAGELPQRRIELEVNRWLVGEHS